MTSVAHVGSCNRARRLVQAKEFEQLREKLLAHRFPNFERRAADMWEQEHVRCSTVRGMNGWLVCKDIEASPGELMTVQCLQDSLIVDEFATSDINEDSAIR